MKIRSILVRYGINEFYFSIFTVCHFFVFFYMILEKVCLIL
ncbi:hypothetical protein BCAH1134_C0217 (plasmid) [Bacillus cereus AH1134]|nr:hypothetical protein BCAH1134_C0217 [Bacillus cereus AH1134]